MRKWQLEEPSGSPQPSASSSIDTSVQVGPSRESHTRSKTTKLTVMRNMSAEKLAHSDFKKMDKKIKTRSVSKKEGVNRASCIEDAHGTKIQDYSIHSDPEHGINWKNEASKIRQILCQH